MTWKVKFANKQKYCTTIYYMSVLCDAGDQQITLSKPISSVIKTIIIADFTAVIQL